MEAFNCAVCFLRFNGGDRKPKSLPCGHTLCESCVRSLPEKRCPQDRRPFDAGALPTNFQLVPDEGSVLVDLEVPWSEIRVGNVIGSGNQGKVVSGRGSGGGGAM